MFIIENHIEIQDGHLLIGGADTTKLAEQYGTPLYVTNESRIIWNFRAYRTAFPDADIYYAAKANGSFAILRLLAREGAGADVFSYGEMYMALLEEFRVKKYSSTAIPRPTLSFKKPWRLA